MTTCALQPATADGRTELALAQAMTRAFIGDFTRMTAGAAPGWPDRQSGEQDMLSRVFVIRTQRSCKREPAPEHSDLKRGTEPGRQVVMRTLIAGICHTFNNILMGIQGNAGLVRYRSPQVLETQQALYKIETHVQAGAFVTNLLLAYLGERRHSARKIRRKQLVDEIIKCVSADRRTTVAKELYEQLVWAARVKSPLLVAGASARLINTLLVEIDRFLEQMSGSGKQLPENLTRLEQIACLVARGQLLAYRLAIYAGDFRPRLAQADLRALLQRLVRDARKRRLDLKIELRPGRQTVAFTDAHLLELGLQELLDNALEASGPGEVVAVEVVASEEQDPRDRFGRNGSQHFLVVTVKDHGAGMDYKTKMRAFDPFFTSKAKCRGKGLGLAVAAGIARRLGGYIHLRSRKGRGTTVSFHLPVEPAGSNAETGEQPN